MGIQRVDTRSVAKIYAECFYKCSGFNLPLDTYITNHTYMIQDGDTPVGGLCVILDKNNFRLPPQLPDNVELPDQDRCGEITGYWYTGTKTWSYILFLYALVRAVFLNRKYYFMYAYSYSNTKLKKYYEGGNPTRLYSGTMSTGALECVEYMSKFGLFLIYAKSIFKKLRVIR